MRGKAAWRTVKEQYRRWTSIVPVLYDWLTSENLVWPSLSCRSEQGRSVDVVRTNHLHKQAAVWFQWDFLIPQIEECFFPPAKRIKELPQNSNIVAIHTDIPDVLIWDVETLSDCQPVIGVTPSPDVLSWRY